MACRHEHALVACADGDVREHVNRRVREHRHHPRWDVLDATKVLHDHNLVGVEGLALDAHEIIHGRHLARRGWHTGHLFPGAHVASLADLRVDACQDLGQVERREAADGLFGEVSEVGLVGADRRAQLARLGLHQSVDLVHCRLQREGRAFGGGLGDRGPLRGPPISHVPHFVEEREHLPPLATVGEGDVVQDRGSQVELRVAVHLPELRLGELDAEPALEGHVEHERVAVAVGLFAVGSEFRARLDDLAGHPPLVTVLLDLGEEPDDVGAEAILGLVDHEVDVRASVHLHERPLEVLDVVGELRQMHRRGSHALETRVGRALAAADRAHVLPREPLGLEVAPVVVLVAALQELDVGLGDDDVVGRTVGVQLLVPLLDELVLDAGAVALLDAVAAHNVEDLQADRVAVPAPARHESDHHARPHLLEASRVLGVERGERRRHPLLAVREVLALVVPPDRERDQLDEVEPQDRVEPRQASGGLRHRLEVLDDEAHAVEDRPVRRLALPVHNRLPDPGGVSGLEGNPEVPARPVEPLFGGVLLEHERDRLGGVSHVDGEVDLAAIERRLVCLIVDLLRAVRDVLRRRSEPPGVALSEPPVDPEPRHVRLEEALELARAGVLGDLHLGEARLVHVLGLDLVRVLVKHDAAHGRLCLLPPLESHHRFLSGPLRTRRPAQLQRGELPALNLANPGCERGRG
mmetsp:Transcript_25212/g.60226  ORF Transcript_25212/g.60226 Transcript_25212/m.60226 type:complete len:695 (-) Transcript_25212:109-2193(-)